MTTPEPGTIWRHEKTDNFYIVLSVMEFKDAEAAHFWRRAIRYAPCMSNEVVEYCRPVSQFTDRFEQIDTDEFHITPGRDELSRWFCLSYASWLAFPRVLLEALPQHLSLQLAQLLDKISEEFNTEDLPSATVQARDRNKFTKWPDWVLNYRRPDRAEIERRRKK